MIEIEEDVRIPGTDVILEKGDQIQVMTEAKDGTKYIGEPFKVTLPSGNIGIGVKVNGETYQFEKTIATELAQAILSLAKSI